MSFSDLLSKLKPISIIGPNGPISMEIMDPIPGSIMTNLGITEKDIKVLKNDPRKGLGALFTLLSTTVSVDGIYQPVDEWKKMGFNYILQIVKQIDLKTLIKSDFLE